MTSSDHQPLPLDPGALPAALRDAYAAQVELRRATGPVAHPSPDALEPLLDETLDDEARLTLVDQLLGSREGLETLAYIAAAKGATLLPAADAASVAPAAAAPLSFTANSSDARQRRISATLKPILLAASLMMVAGTSWYVFTLPPRADDVREAGAAVELLPALEGSAAEPLSLTWKSLRSSTRYRVEVLDANDDPVFTTETSDTVAVVPSGSLRAGGYRWWVRSTAADGSEVRSRVEKLTIR